MSTENIKKAFYERLEKAGMTPQEFVDSEDGMNLLKVAVLAKQARGGVMDAIRAYIDAAYRKSPDALLGAGAALGTLGGTAGGMGAAVLTAPTDRDIGNLQRQELISEYSDAINKLRDRIELNELRRAL